MEPWHFSHGEPPVHFPKGDFMNASMEPWHFSHGERAQAIPVYVIHAVLQWSHGILAMESHTTPDHHHRRHSFNGAMAF